MIQNSVSTIDSLRQAAAAQRLPFALTETNSIANTPTDAVGHSFGQALWTADHLFTGLEHGVDFMNMHSGIPGDATSPIVGDGTTAGVQSTYYGMLFFRQATIAGGHTVQLTASNTQGLNVSAHAIRDYYGKLHLAIINKDAKDSTVTINLGKRSARGAKILRLTAPTVDAQTGFQLGGAAVAANGPWSANQTESVQVSNNVSSATISVPAYSAALITF